MQRRRMLVLVVFRLLNIPGYSMLSSKRPYFIKGPNHLDCFRRPNLDAWEVVCVGGRVKSRQNCSLTYNGAMALAHHMHVYTAHTKLVSVCCNGCGTANAKRQHSKRGIEGPREKHCNLAVVISRDTATYTRALGFFFKCKGSLLTSKKFMCTPPNSDLSKKFGVSESVSK